MHCVVLLCGNQIGPESDFMTATEKSGQYYMMCMYVPYLLLFAQGASIEVVSPG